MGLPLQIGVTGGIGSGKSVVCRLFSCLGIPVYEADMRAKWLMNHDSAIRNSITDLLGTESYTADGTYNTRYVSSRVFNNADLLKSLNAIVHPAVGKDTAGWIDRHSHEPYIIKEAAIMNRAGDANTLDYVIVVEAPIELKVKRILKRDKRSEEEIRAIMARQLSDGDRRLVADFIVTNDEQSALIPQVLLLHKRFLGVSGK